MDHTPGKNPKSPPTSHPPTHTHPASPGPSPWLPGYSVTSSKPQLQALRQGTQMALPASQTPLTGQRTQAPFFRKQTSLWHSPPPTPHTFLFSAETNPLIKAKAPVNPRLIKAATKLAKKRAHGMEDSIANKQEAGYCAEILSVPILRLERCG